jgi:hypothetical protein
VRLDSTGRWLLNSIDYRVWGLIFLVVIIGFTFWRRSRYDSWPSREDYLRLLLSLAAASGGMTVMAVFLLTKPPAIDMLSGAMLDLLGLGIPVLLFGESFPRLRALFLPPQAPKPSESLGPALGTDNPKTPSAAPGSEKPQP